MTAQMLPLGDHIERERIRTELDSTLFVNAGAGSGKTSELVQRVASLVLGGNVRLARLAAVTFTEKAGAELRDRLRSTFESAHANAALDDLDGAAIGTLHSFAQRILGEHPIEAGLPPIIEVLDEVGSSVAFDERWAGLQSELLDDDAIARPLLVAMALGVELKHLRSLALLLGKDWDLIGDRVLTGAEPTFAEPDLAGLFDEARAVLALQEHCAEAGDRLLAKFSALAGYVSAYEHAADAESRLAVAKDLGDLKFSRNEGRRENWRCPVDEVRRAGNDVAERAKATVAAVLDSCLRILTCWIARRVVDAADVRRREGRLEFHDLLVMTRDLLRRDSEVRAAVHDDYQRVLLDEFQDTDPIQIELAVRICAGAAGGADDWRTMDVPAGRLFVVGDAKQSIYRFRRANIATYLDAQEHIGRPAELRTNFRTVEPIVTWINAVFDTLITATPGQQPPYAPLDAHRDERGSGPAVVVLGADPHLDAPRAAELREREAADVAAVVRQAIDEGWTVYDERQHTWRPARHDDIAILVPARTSLPYLEDALDAAGIAYRAEASSLVYHADEVRGLLAAARAIADPSDALSLVAALRSTMFGCGDDDLWRWKRGGGRFVIYSEIDGPEADGPVGSALHYLRRAANAARWLAPSEVLTMIAADRRMFEVAATGPRARDSWRRLRFVIDQARAWSETSHGGLRAYLAWVAHQGQEASRVAEAVLPETDADSVRVMTVHAAKGLEFPIVVLSGMTSQGNPPSGVSVLWPAEGGYAVKFKKSVQTDDFEAAVPIDEQMDDKEKRRLLYVAATRARDHLVVSLHRSATGKNTAARLIADASGATAAGAVPFDGYAFDRSADVPPVVTPPPPYEQWRVQVDAALAASRHSPVLSASGLEGTEPEVVLDGDVDPGRAKGPRNLELPPWSKGRYGSAVGRAVHAVLQVVDLATGAGLDEAVRAQVVAEGVLDHEQLVRDLALAALGADSVQRAAARQHWREMYAGAPRADGVLVEGYLDLVYRDDDGALVVVDYKTDAVPPDAIDSRVTYYKPQMDAYVAALRAATGASVRATLLFLHPAGTVAVDV